MILIALPCLLQYLLYTKHRRYCFVFCYKFFTACNISVLHHSLPLRQCRSALLSHRTLLLLHTQHIETQITSQLLFFFFARAAPLRAHSHGLLNICTATTTCIFIYNVSLNVYIAREKYNKCVYLLAAKLLKKKKSSKVNEYK